MDINKILKLKQFKAKELEEENNEILIYGELQKTDKSCPKCGKENEKPHQYHERKMRTAPFNDKHTYLIFTVKAHLCANCGHRFLETADFYEKHQRYTLDYEKYIHKLARKNNLNWLSENEGMSWDTINAIFLKGTEKRKQSFCK